MKAADLRLGRIFSEQAVNILSTPCKTDEFLRRREVFLNADSDEARGRLSSAVSSIREYRRTLELWRAASNKLSAYFAFSRLTNAYASAVGALSAISDLGSIFAEFHVELEPTPHFPELSNMRCFLLSFSDKAWITPNESFTDEFDELTECAVSLGLTAPIPKAPDIKPFSSLSDAVCNLFAEDCEKADADLKAYADFDFERPLKVLPMLEFFAEILALTDKAKTCGIPHCLPAVLEHRGFTARELYDITLLKNSCEIIPNDVCFTEAEPFFFLTGANGGGKTTYLRAVGVNLMLFLAGCPIFARGGAAYPFSEVLTHFPVDERFDDIGRLDEELLRAKKMLSRPDSFLLFNETFSGADEERGFSLLTKTAEAINSTGQFGLYVTHFHNVSSLAFPRLTTEIDTEDANRRTYRIVRTNRTASSHAADILKKYKLDRSSLDERRRKL